MERARFDVIVLELVRRGADAALVQGPLAAAAIAGPHLSSRVRRNVVVVGGGRCRWAWSIGEPLFASVGFEDEIEPFAENVLESSGGMLVAQHGLCRFQLLEKFCRHRH